MGEKKVEKPFCIRLLSGKGQRGPSFGCDEDGEARLMVFPGGAPDSRFEGSAFLGLDDDDAILLLDDGGNVLHRYAGMHGPGKGISRPSFASFTLGLFLCGLASGEDIMMPEHGRCLFLSGADLLIVFLRTGERGKTSFEVIARTRAIENRMFVILADGSCPPVAFDPDGEEILPVRAVDGTLEISAERDAFSTGKEIPFRRKDLYYSLTAL